MATLPTELMSTKKARDRERTPREWREGWLGPGSSLPGNLQDVSKGEGHGRAGETGLVESGEVTKRTTGHTRVLDCILITRQIHGNYFSRLYFQDKTRYDPPPLLRV